MALKLSVKIGDVTNLSDARYAAGMGVDYIGFNINQSTDNFVSAKNFKEITNWVSGVGIIGEVGHQPPDSSDEYPSYLTETSDPSLFQSEVIYRVDGNDIGSIDELIANQEQVLFTIIELSNEQIKNNEEQLTALCNSRPIYLSASFTEDVLDLITTKINPKGIEIKGGIEDQPGFKDYDGIADVLEWLEIEE